MGSRIRDNVKHFFECFCEIVRPNPGSENNKPGVGAPWIIQKFPESYKNEEVLRSVTNFAYPCQFENVSVQHYSFVLTNIDSKWTFGFCRHDPNTETALVILTYLPWHAAFRKFLDTIANTENNLWDFLSACYNARVPEAGFGTFQVDSFIVESPCQFQLPRIPENRNLTEYYNAVDITNMIVIFTSMLYERRIIFKSKRLDRLSACVQSANDLIYPMIWQHIFIPVLPIKLKDYLLAPMPFLIGVPTLVFEATHDLGDVVILDLDNNIVTTPFDDSLPQDIISSLKRTLKNNVIGDCISRAFLQALVQLIGGYRDALRFTPGQKITFCEDAFVETRGHGMQPFLKKMLDLQIFQQFVEERLQMLNAGMGFTDEFEKEACRYSEKTSNSKLKQQYKEFIKSVKDKANPAVKSAVKSVKEGGKGMRTAYKGLRSKFKDNQSGVEEQHQQPKPRSAPNSPTRTSYRRGGDPFYTPLSPTTSGGNDSPPPIAPLNNLDLLHEMQHVLYKRHNNGDDSGDNTPPVDRSLKPVRSLESFKASSNWWVDLEGPSDDVFAANATTTHNHKNGDTLSLIPDVRISTKEPDLIRLDSTPSDIDEDDFDPLFRKSIPEKGLSNPLYPYFVPTATTSQDQELLNEYGLDFQKFSLTNKRRDPFDPFVETQQQQQQTRKWTKFE